MTSGNDFDSLDPADRLLFAARLTPHRSLSRTGFVVLMAVASAISFGAGLVFLLMGAWPVFGFFGLDVLLIYWAFRINFRHARASEDISNFFPPAASECFAEKGVTVAVASWWMQFQSLQSGHCPAHLAKAEPQLWQT